MAHVVGRPSYSEGLVVGRPSYSEGLVVGRPSYSEGLVVGRPSYSEGLSEWPMLWVDHLTVRDSLSGTCCG